MASSIIRKIVLLLCIAFAVVAFGFPCFIVPFGSYDGESYKIYNGEEIQYKWSYEFGFDGKVKYTETSYDKKQVLYETEYYYKLKRNKVYLNEEKQFDNLTRYLTISSIIRLGDGSFNIYSCAVSIGVAVIAGALVVSTPRKRS